MQNMNQGGTIVSMTVPVGGVTAGQMYLIGTNIVVVAMSTVAYVAGAKFQALVDGVITLAKQPSQALPEGTILYWDNTNKYITSTSGGNTKAGVAIDGGALAADTKVKMRFYLMNS